MIAYQCDRPGCGVLYNAREPQDSVQGIVFYPKSRERIAHLCEGCESVFVRYWGALRASKDASGGS